jgi:endonuclease/exonuclease/phosphatase family metal-dependent hydrolase
VIGLLILALTLVGGCAQRAPVTTPPSPIILAVITWNTHAGHGDLSRLLDDLSSGRLSGAPVSDYVLLLQEAIVSADTDVLALTRARRLSTFYAPVRQTIDRASGNAIVSTRMLMSTRVIDLPQERQPRTAVVATIDVDGHPLFIACAHLENRISLVRGGLFSENARRRQAETLLSALPNRGHGIVGGDFNTWLGPNEPAWKLLAARFSDTPRAAPEPTFRDRLVLDHLFFDMPDGWHVTRRVIRERYGSDHHPVLGLIRRD